MHFYKYQSKGRVKVCLRLRIYHIKNGDADVANLRFKGYNKYDGRTETENIHCTEKDDTVAKARNRKSSSL